jgi:hypothetical protein
VLASRKWTGKTLTDHRADRAAVVRQTLAAAGIDVPDRDRYATTVLSDDGLPRFEWTPLDRDRDGAADYAAAIVTAAMQRARWRAQYDTAKRGAQAGTDPL